MSSPFCLSAIHLGGSDWIDQIQDQNYDPGLGQLLHAGDGDIDARFIALMTQAPMFDFTTTALARTLLLCPNAGRVIDDSSGDPIDFYFRKRAMGAAYETGTKHLRVRVPKGYLYLKTLAGEYGQVATGQFSLAAVKGSSPIVTVARNVAIPAIGALTKEAFTVGPWWVNTYPLTAVLNFTLETGIELGSIAGDGELSPTMVYIKDRAMTMGCSTTDLEWLDEAAQFIGPAGAARSGNTRAFLRKKEGDAANVADGVAEHIRLELNKGRIQPGTTGGSHGDNSLLQIAVSAINDGSNDPLAISTTAVIAGT